MGIMDAQFPDNSMPGPAQGNQPAGGDGQSSVKRGLPEVDAARKALVSRWQSEIKADKRHFDKDFKRMKDDMDWALLGAEKIWVEAKKYTVPLIGRHINQSVAALYAKNPRAYAKRKPRLNFVYWDGTPETAQAAFQNAAFDPMAAQIVQEIEQAKMRNTMLNKLGRTMEILFGYYTGENTPNFKQQMKQHVRRAKTCGVSYMELNFQRVLEPDPEVSERIDDMTQQIATIESKLADAADGLISEGDADMEQLKLDLQDLQSQKMIIAREGVTFDFPRANEIIPHRACKQLRGFEGADYVSHEFHLTPEEIQEIYKIDVSVSYKQYTQSSTGGSPDDRSATGGATAGRDDKGKVKKACLWRVQDKKNRQIFTIVEGYPDFVKAPEPHPLQVNGFWTIFPLTFNDIEHGESVIPYSDVYHLRHPQREYNNARQGLREHRKANRPKYFTRAGALEEAEKKKLQDAPAHAVIEIKGMDAETPLENIVVPFKPVPIDQSLYETRSILNDILYGVGVQSADLGPTNDSTATQSSISEQGRQSTLSSNVDDLDEHLSDVAAATGQVMLAELSVQTVQEIAGPGAVWPQLDSEEISKELLLAIKAGSSGRPNKAAELANMERGMPYLIQLGGVSGTTLARRYADLLDIDEEELIVEGLPSIVAMNAMASKQGAQPQPGPGSGKPDPNQQGGQGGNNAPQQPQNEPGPQPKYPAHVVQNKVV